MRGEKACVLGLRRGPHVPQIWLILYSTYMYLCMNFAVSAELQT